MHSLFTKIPCPQHSSLHIYYYYYFIIVNHFFRRVFLLVPNSVSFCFCLPYSKAMLDAALALALATKSLRSGSSVSSKNCPVWLDWVYCYSCCSPSSSVSSIYSSSSYIFIIFPYSTSSSSSNLIVCLMRTSDPNSIILSILSFS